MIVYLFPLRRAVWRWLVGWRAIACVSYFVGFFSRRPSPDGVLFSLSCSCFHCSSSRVHHAVRHYTKWGFPLMSRTAVTDSCVGLPTCARTSTALSQSFVVYYGMKPHWGILHTLIAVRYVIQCTVYDATNWQLAQLHTCRRHIVRLSIQSTYNDQKINAPFRRVLDYCPVSTTVLLYVKSPTVTPRRSDTTEGVPTTHRSSCRLPSGTIQYCVCIRYQPTRNVYCTNHTLTCCTNGHLAHAVRAMHAYSMQ
jgi:hypothetical protein